MRWPRVCVRKVVPSIHAQNRREGVLSDIFGRQWKVDVLSEYAYMYMYVCERQCLFFVFMHVKLLRCECSRMERFLYSIHETANDALTYGRYYALRILLHLKITSGRDRVL